MTIPRNVARFEILSYLSLLISLAGAALYERSEFTGMDMFTTGFASVFLIVIIAAICWFIYLAARKRKSWARWALVGVEVFDVGSVLTQLNEPIPELALDIVSAVLAIVGLYFAFTGDAKEWFRPSQTT